MSALRNTDYRGKVTFFSESIHIFKIKHNVSLFQIKHNVSFATIYA